MSQGPFIHSSLDLGDIAAALVEGAVYPVAGWDEAGHVLIWNGKMAELTGWSVAELENRALYDILCMDERERESLIQLTRDVFMGRHPRETDVGLGLLKRDGTHTIVACRPFPLVSRQGSRPVGVAGIFQDLGDVERPIVVRVQDPASKVAVDQEMATLIFRVDAKTGRLIFANNLMAAFLGYEPSVLLGDQRLMPARVLPEYDESFNAAMESAIRGVARSVEVGFVHAEGHSVFCVMTMYPLKGLMGQVLSVEVVARDVTGRKAAEARLARSLDELREAYDALQIQHEDLKSVERLKSQILANVSHELRTPLVTIRGYNDLMRQGALGDLTEGQRKGLDISARSIQRLLTLIENLLDYARIDRRGLHPRRDTLDFVAILKSALDDIQDEAMRKHLDMDISLPMEPVTVSCDGKRMKKVFFNLLDNAVKFSKDSGRISVKCFESGTQELCVEIGDEGIGIPEQELRRIFDGFYQVDGSTTRPYPGAGIGLAVSKEIVVRHGGRIEVASTPGKGTSFLVYLPIAQHTLAAVSKGEGGASEARTGNDALDTVRIVPPKVGKETGESSSGVLQESPEGGKAEVPLDISKIDR